MKRKIFVHIGLPKTATTSLQRDLFSQLESLEYAGVSYPRSWEFDTSTIYGAFMVGMYSGDMGDFKRALEVVDEDKPILISEEMITVVTVKSDWKQNLKNLRSLLDEHDYRLLITIRDPLDAMFSYYVERYDYFRSNYKVFDQQILDSLDMEVFRYQRFIRFLGDEFGSDRVYVADYSKITSGQFNEVERFLGSELPEGFEMYQHNSKSKGSSKIYLNKKSSLYGFIYKLAQDKLNTGILRSWAKRLQHVVKPLLECIAWRRGVPTLSDSQKQELRDLLIEDVNLRNKLLHEDECQSSDSK
ncbi:sulfotransferase [Akkermansiaceae bacterium]|nr:sulfotransferase [Akkermansiaceae bacterium]